MSVDAPTAIQRSNRDTATRAEFGAVYVGFFWDEFVKEVTFQLSSMSLARLIEAMHAYLVSVEMTDLDFKLFLLEQVNVWDGTATHVTTIAHGKLVMLKTIPDASAEPSGSSVGAGGAAQATSRVGQQGERHDR